MATNKGNMNLRMTDGRAEVLREAMQLTGENTKAGAIDVALKHYVRDYRNKETLVDELDPDVVEKLSTPELPLRKEIEISVGPDKRDK